MSSASMTFDVTPHHASGPFGRILYFDPDPQTSKLTIVGVHLAGYEVSATVSLDEVRQVLARVEGGGESLLAVVIDACTNPLEAEQVFAAVKACRFELPIILLTHRDRPNPFAASDDVPCLRRPFATPLLVRLLHHFVGDPTHTTTPASMHTEPAFARHAAPRIGGYEVLAELARGGMGTVYLCRREGEAGFQRLHALKVLHPHLGQDPAFVAMLLDEARLASRIHHPNVAAVVDVGRDQAGYFVVMEYVEGPTLDQLLKRVREARPPEIIVPIMVEILEGLHAAHTLEDSDGSPLHIVHRDVSPQNILVGADGTARIADFGVAKARARVTNTKEGVLKGKLAYLAPEQLMDDETIDGRADVFAAGAVLWSALTSLKLFADTSEAKILRNVLDKPIPAPSTVGARPPACLDAVCLRALERDPSKRWSSALAMAEALREVAVRNGLYASPSTIGAWVKEHFANELAYRKHAVRVRSGGRSGANAAILGETHDALATVVVDSSPAARSDLVSRRRRSATPWIVIAVALLAIGGTLGALELLRARDEGGAASRVAQQPSEDRSPSPVAPPKVPAAAAPKEPEPPAPPAAITTRTEVPAPAPAPEAVAPLPADPGVVDDARARRRKGPSHKGKRQIDPGPAAPKPAEPAPKPAPRPAPKSAVEANPYK